MLRLGVSNAGNGSDALRACRALLLTGVPETCREGEENFRLNKLYFWFDR